MSGKCAVVIVTHNSQKDLSRCLESLQQQTNLASQIIVVDSGSENIEYLKNSIITTSLYRTNIGFCKANNSGFSCVNPKSDYVLFLNPDTILTPSFLEEADFYLRKKENYKVGALSGILLGFDRVQNKPTGKIDSRGIFRSWLGRWYDRDQGKVYYEKKEKVEEVPALCGALLFCRYKALQEVEITPDEIMDSSFFMYKEDIDLSLRLRKKGWSLHYVPYLKAYHCRGWHTQRKQMPYHLRVLSARNDMRVYAKIKSPYFLLSFLKYVYVRWIES